MLDITVVVNVNCLLSRQIILSAGVGYDFNIDTLSSQYVNWFIDLYIYGLLPVIHFYLFIAFHAFWNMYGVKRIVSNKSDVL